MEIKQIEFSNYKLFESEQKIKISPITILIGKNSAGKSTGTRRPAVPKPQSGTSNSSALNARMAIAQLGNIKTLAELEKYLNGETRTTVLSRGNSRRNALQG